MPDNRNNLKRHKGNGRGSHCVLIDYDTFVYCYEEWRNGRMKVNEFAKRCKVTNVTIYNRLNYIYNHNGTVPMEWFSKNGEDMANKYIEEHPEKYNNGNGSNNKQ